MFPCTEGTGNVTEVHGKVFKKIETSFMQVQDILDQNRLLINEINRNHESRIPQNLTRNIGLIRELNNNIKRMVDLYADLSSSVTRSMETAALSEEESSGKASQKRIRFR